MKRFGRLGLASVAAVGIVLSGGCRLSYHLRGQGGTATLMPPVRPVVLKGDPSVYLIRVSKARSRPAVWDGCDIENELIGLQWAGKTVEIRYRPDSYFPAAGDERPEEVAPRVYLDSLQRVDAFRAALEDRVVRGCLRSDEARDLARTIVERLPLPPLIAQFIRFGGGSTGFVDLTANFRMKVVSPVRSDGDSKEVVDYQIAYYRLTPSARDARIRISLASISTGQTEEARHGGSVSAGPIEWPDSFLFYRLLFRAANSATDHLAAIVSAENEAMLNEATRRFEREWEPSCAVLSVPGVTCVRPAADISVNLEFPVSVNGRQIYVPLGGTVSDAIQSRSVARGMVATLRVRRLFRGHLCTVRFDPAKQDITRFALMPGDEITYRAPI